MQHLCVVFKTDEIPGCTDAVPVCQTIVDSAEQRVNHKNAVQNQCWQHKAEFQYCSLGMFDFSHNNLSD